jgi:DNA-directed RNA polymerase I subunit RPA1
MTASRELKTPTMSVPLDAAVSEKEALKLTRSFKKLTLNELIAGRHGITVRETLSQSEAGLWERAYYVTLKFHPAERIKEAFGLNLNDIAKVVAKSFVPALSHQMKLELRRSATDGDGKVTVEGGESSEYVHSTSKDNEEAEGRKSRETDLLDDEAEEGDDDSDDEVGEEDGVRATRAQAESYGGRDDDERSTASSNSSVADTEEDGTQDTKEGTTVAFDLTSTLSFSGDGSIKLDKKENALHLQPLRVDPSARPLLMVGLVETAATKTVVRSKKKIDQAFINDEEGRGRCLQTAGINFEEIWKLDAVNHNKLLSNDIWAVRCAYGVEAARNNIVDQIRSVFGAYGIEVDPRHLSLIADYMTNGGEFTALNRIGMRNVMSSPFLQMSFETTAQFLTQAAVTASSDALNSPSANIVVGRPIRHGTGAFSLLTK